jgi:hypothetical protein
MLQSLCCQTYCTSNLLCLFYQQMWCWVIMQYPLLVYFLQCHLYWSLYWQVEFFPWKSDRLCRVFQYISASTSTGSVGDRCLISLCIWYLIGCYYTDLTAVFHLRAFLKKMDHIVPVEEQFEAYLPCCASFHNCLPAVWSSSRHAKFSSVVMSCG